MKILFVCYDPPDKGGLAINTHIIAKCLKKFRVDVLMASTENYPGLETFIFRKYHRKNPIFILNELYLAYFLKKIIKKHSVDIIHAQDRLTSLGALRAAKSLKIPSVIHFQDYWFACPNGTLLRRDLTECPGAKISYCFKCMSGKRFLWELYKLFFLVRPSWKKLERADIKIAASKKVAEKLKLCGIQTNVEVLHNPVTDSFFQEVPEREKSKIKSKYGLKKIVVSCFSELSIHKGTLNLMRIIKHISQERGNNDLSFLIIGWGDLSNYCLNFIKKNNLTNVIFLAFISPDNIKFFYAISDIFLVPSIWQDPLPRVATEALSTGVPVIASNVGGLRDLIIDKKTGFLLDSFDIDEWENKIKFLIANPLLRQQLGRNAKQDAVKRFREKVILDKLIKLYQQLA